ncbi:MAG: hypothetical protein HRT86_06720 [Ilumatobacteraceae bacterium]|nr:hypothetical protein [Ilumatobacteraceae bacterium]
MLDWIRRELIDDGRLPLFLALLAFVLTFLATRVVTRLIRSGRGPFRDNVTASGIHVHHAVPGLLILITGAFTAVGTQGTAVWPEVAAVLVGVGTSLVLDEFALILRLDDVYWNQEGRISLELVALATACLGLALVGFNPVAASGVSDDALSLTGVTRVVAIVFPLVIHATAIIVDVAKGKYRLALLGAFIPLLAAIGAILPARPESTWAGRRYSTAKLERARTWHARLDRLIGSRMQWLYDLIGGAPSGPGDDDPQRAAAGDRAY